MFLSFVSAETFILLTRLRTDAESYEHWKALARATLLRQPQREIAIGQIANALREWLHTEVPRTEGLAGTLLACSLERINLYEVASDLLSENSLCGTEIISSKVTGMAVESLITESVLKPRVNAVFQA